MTLDTQMTLALLQELLIALGGFALLFYILYKVAFSQCLPTESSLIRQREDLKPNVHLNHTMRS